jgi:hypothetical protein
MPAELGLTWPARPRLSPLSFLHVSTSPHDVEALAVVQLDATITTSSEQGSPPPRSGRLATRTRPRLAAAPPGTVVAALGPRKLTGAYARERRRLLAGAGKHTAVPHYRAAVHVAAIARGHRKLCNRYGSTRELKANTWVPSPTLGISPSVNWGG